MPETVTCATVPARDARVTRRNDNKKKKNRRSKEAGRKVTGGTGHSLAAPQPPLPVPLYSLSSPVLTAEPRSLATIEQFSGNRQKRFAL